MEPVTQPTEEPTIAPTTEVNNAPNRKSDHCTDYRGADHRSHH